MTLKNVSVIISAKNTKPYLREAIYSVLKQELPKEYNLLILLGIDSDPELIEEAKKINDKRLEIYYSEKHVGPYIIRNSLLDKSSGNYFCIFDSDDIMLPGILKKGIEELNSGNDIVGYWFEFVEKDLKKTGRVNKVGSDNSIIYTKDTLNILGGYEPWVCQADTEFIRRAKAFGLKIKILDEIGILYRRYPEQLTQKIPPGHPERIKVQEEINKRVSMWNNNELQPFKVERKTVELIKIK